ncbi:MAG TPA: hypothetical protein VEF53_01020 [Patescibacteria group bacterium]|nr:hypothetical protein [Patescibacteria group bacterium]
MPSKNLIELLELAKGNRSLNTFAQHASVSAGNLSRVFNGQKPSPELLKKIADKAYNDVTYEQLMNAAGYINLDTVANENQAIHIVFDTNFKKVEDAYEVDPEMLIQMCRAVELPEEERKKIKEYSALIIEKFLREKAEKEKLDDK